MYDAALGRWHCIDPLAEDFYNQSPYNYVANNPVNFMYAYCETLLPVSILGFSFALAQTVPYL